jgi:hypothetical protein
MGRVGGRAGRILLCCTICESCINSCMNSPSKRKKLCKFGDPAYSVLSSDPSFFDCWWALFGNRSSSEATDMTAQ